MPGRVALVVRGVKRAAPLVMEAYRRWDRLTPADKERYKKRVRQSGTRARDAAAKAGGRVRRRR